MNAPRLLECIDQMQEAATQACIYVEGMDYEAFVSDRRTQQAVILNILAIGETVNRIYRIDPEFVERSDFIPWTNMRGMRNRIAHGYFDINIEVVWDTVLTALPELLKRLPRLRLSADKPQEDKEQANPE